MDWAAQDDNHLIARLTVDDVETVLELRVDRAGLLGSVSFDRWGDPDETGIARLHPMGPHANATATFGGLGIPVAGDAGWFYGTDRWSDGEFFGYQITALEPIRQRWRSVVCTARRRCV